MHLPLPDSLFPSLSSPDVGQLFRGANGAFTGFALIVARMSGLVFVGPVFGHSRVNMPTRIFLVLATSFVMAPTLLGTGHRPSFDFAMSPLLEFAGFALGELAVGAALGLGVLTIVSAVGMAGTFLNQQWGLSTNDSFHPEMDSDGSISAGMLHRLALVVFLIAGGHTLMVSALLDTFQSLPIGEARLTAPLVDLLIDLVGQSLALTVQIAAPVMATMAVLNLAVGFLGRAIPQMSTQVLALPARVLAGFLVLALAFTGITGLLVRAVETGIEQVRQVLTAL